MRVCLINPSFSKEGGKKWVPYGLIRLATSISNFSDVKILTKENNDISFLVEEIISYQPDVIGISLQIDSIYNAIEIASAVKKKCPDKIVVGGGPHATLIGNSISIISKGFDYIILGEADHAFPLFLQDINNSIDNNRQRNISKIISPSKDKGYIVNNLNELPFQRIDFIKLDDYYQVAFIQGSRGCPHICPFCAEPTLAGKVLRYRTSENILNEIKYLNSRFNIKYIRFIDACFNYPSLRFHDICKKIKNSDVKIKWTCFARLDFLNEELIISAYHAGCVGFFFGVESFYPKITDYLNKKCNLPTASRMLKLAKELGIHTHINLITGFPCEDNGNSDLVVKTINFLSPDSVFVTPLYIVPKTDFDINAKLWNIIFLDEDWRTHLHEYYRSNKKYFKTLLMNQEDMQIKADILKEAVISKGFLWNCTDSAIIACLSQEGSIEKMKALWNNYV